MIRQDDRLAAVLDGNGLAVERLAWLAPALQRLRDPELRGMMSRLITVRQAAEMGKVGVVDLMWRLDGVIRLGLPESNEMRETRAVAAPGGAGLPSGLAAIPAERIVTLDVREDLRSGREPFSLIMAARARVPEGGALSVRAIFEPVPLYAVMARQGFEHHTEELADDDWRVWFYPAERPAPPPTKGAGGPPGEQEPGVLTLDVRDLEPPEPMVRTLAALESLPPGGTLVHLNVRVPQFLLPQLEDRGFTYEIREQAPDLVRVFIRRAESGRRAVTEQPTGTHMQSPRTLDVRVIPPREKHPRIFDAFAALAPGESFILVNDHDPKPLRYQFEYEHKGEFGWQYLEQGPSVWRVEISRTAAA